MPLSDLIIADRGEAVSINAEGGNHLKRWDCLEAKGIDTVKVGTLSQILANRPLTDARTRPGDERRNWPSDERAI